MKNSRSPYDVLKGIVLNKGTASMESLRRVRQKFQENGLYVGTKRKNKLDESELVSKWAIEN